MTPYNVIPMVIERSALGERAYDIFSLLLKERVVMLGTQVNAESANLLVAQLLFLNREDNERPIQMYVNSPGGEVYSGMAIYDTMQQISAPVATTAVGITASFGTVILTSGDKGMRSALPHATVHMHQPLGGTQGQASDIVIHAKHYQNLKDRLNRILAERTGQDLATIERDTDRDIYFSAEQAVEYGLVDQVIEARDVVSVPELSSNGHHKNGKH
jgi:ATP-dependent Clp protease, protease subunit